MKKIISLLICVVMLAAMFICVQAEGDKKTEYSELFAKDSVIDVKINIDETDLADMREYPTNEEYHKADITVDGITVENAGIRTKGNMTLSSVANMDSERYSYRIKFNKYVKGQKLLGLNELCLNDGFSDPSYMREYLHYEIMRQMGLNVPETVYCNVYINDEYAGFYLAVEALDSSFAETEFDDPNEEGNLYKMEEGATLVYNSEENYSYADLKVGNDTEHTGLKAFIKALNDMPEGEKGDIEKYLDVESALKYIAGNTVLSNYDSYNGFMCHNYYLYENAEGVFTVVPWDFNMSFGGNGGDTTIGIDTPVSGGNIDNLPLIKNLLAVDEYKEMYYGYIKEMMDILESFENRVSELKAIIKPYVENDTTAFYTVEDFEKATSKSEESTQAPDTEQQTELPDAEKQEKRGHGFGNSKSIINCVTERLENLKAQFDGTAERSTSNNPGFGGGRRADNNGQRENRDGNMPPEGFQPPEGLQPPEGFQPPDDGEQKREFPGRHDGFKDRDKKTNDVIRVHIDGHILSFDENPVLDDGTTLVEYRSVMEELGAKIEWDKDSKTITAIKDDTTIILTVGSDTADINGEKVSMLKAPEITNDHTMIPVRFISEQLGMKVKWNEDTKLIEITSK